MAAKTKVYDNSKNEVSVLPKKRDRKDSGMYDESDMFAELELSDGYEDDTEEELAEELLCSAMGVGENQEVVEADRGRRVRTDLDSDVTAALCGHRKP